MRRGRAFFSLQVWVTRESHPAGTPQRGDARHTAGPLSQLEGPYAAHRLLTLYDEKWIRGSLQVRPGLADLSKAVCTVPRPWRSSTLHGGAHFPKDNVS